MRSDLHIPAQSFLSAVSDNSLFATGLPYQRLAGSTDAFRVRWEQSFLMVINVDTVPAAQPSLLSATLSRERARAAWAGGSRRVAAMPSPQGHV